MDEAVGERLPESAVQEDAGNETETRVQAGGSGRMANCASQQGEVGSEVPENQAAGGAAELGEGKRSGAKSGIVSVTG
jgi:hypothetical protein